MPGSVLLSLGMVTTAAGAQVQQAGTLPWPGLCGCQLGAMAMACRREGAAAEGQMGLKILKNGGKSLRNRSFLHSGLLNQSWNPMEE